MFELIVNGVAVLIELIGLGMVLYGVVLAFRGGFLPNVETRVVSKMVLGFSLSVFAYFTSEFLLTYVDEHQSHEEYTENVGKVTSIEHRQTGDVFRIDRRYEAAESQVEDVKIGDKVKYTIEYPGTITAVVED